VSDDTFAVTVEADPDASGEMLPRCFRLGARSVEVVDVLDRWPGADHLYVKLRGADGATYILRRGPDGAWRLVLFQHPRAEENGPGDRARGSHVPQKVWKTRRSGRGAA
jgi:hypothetical protein